MTEEFIERRIVIGFIVSTEFVQQIRTAWEPQLIESSTARQLIGWCISYFDKYNKAPKKDIEGIYTEKLREGLDKAQAEWIEMVLSSLSDEYEREQFNSEYLLDQTRKYFQERRLKLHVEDIDYELQQGNVLEAERLALSYNSTPTDEGSVIDPFDKSSRDKIKQAFTECREPLIHYPKALGKFWNHELVRDGFVALMGREKVGKTFMLLDLATRAMKSGCNVVFFQAGDMTENQQLRRIAIYLTKRSDQERYCGLLYVPQADCLKNLLDICDKDEREENERVFESEKNINYDTLVEACKEYPDHIPCHNCATMKGVPWLRERKPVQPLKWKQAYRHLRKFKRRYKKRFLLSSHATGTLSISQIKTYLSLWEKQKDFVPDVIIIDYADILAPDPDFSRLDYRHQQNAIWQQLHNLSQERHCLVLTATQIKAQGYSKELITMEEYSETKTKLAHVTAMYGLNQTWDEKRIGLMRINEIVVREGEFDTARPVTVLQRLQMGRPVLGSY